MSLRRTVRNAIKSGSTMYARVEEVNLGLATVRLSATGKRMTNLSILGGEVQAGDEVVVDWSAGTNPLVRPLFLEEPEPILPPGTSAPEATFEEVDISALESSVVWYYPSYEDDFGYIVYANQPHVLCGGEYDPPYEEGDAYGHAWAETMDSADIIDTSQRFTFPGYMRIPKSGKYLIWFTWDEHMVWNWGNVNCGYDISNPSWNESGSYYRIRVLLNDTTPIGVGTGLYGMGDYGGTSCQIFTIQYLETGDKLSFELFYTSSVCIGTVLENWFSYSDEARARWIMYLPGT